MLFHIRSCIYILFFLFSISSFATECTDIFGSKLFYEKKVISQQEQFRALHPNYIDPVKEKKLVELWNKKPPTPKLLESLLPEDVHFINHQLHQPNAESVVKLAEQGSSVMARAYYKYQNHVYGTNVVFSTRALIDNLNSHSGQNWLVGENATAAILFLHGGGSKSSGAHVAGPMVNHFRNYGIDVLSLDLPWHSNGHREFLRFESEIETLSAFAKKYIPPNIPLFVWGHSWGSVFAEQLMRMTDRPKKEFVFHNNLKGAIILSTAVDSAPGKSRKEKQEEYNKRIQYVRENPTKFKEANEERGFWKTIINDGKISPLGVFYSSGTIFQLDQSPPSHQGRNFIPALMIVGKHDSLVYLGFEKLYKVYENLKNVETHYLEELPYFRDSKNSPMKKVGHLLGDYLDPGTREQIDFFLARKFIAKILVSNSMKPRENKLQDLLDAIINSIQNNSPPGKINDFKEQLNILLKSQLLDRINIPESLINKAEETQNNTPAPNKNIPESLEKSLLTGSQIRSSLTLLRDHLSSNHLDQALTIAKSLHQKIKDLIAFKIQEADIQKQTNNKDTPVFIRLLQNFSNNLAFREFIKKYILYNEKGTLIYKNIFKEKIPEMQNNLLDILEPYSTPAKRITHIFNDINNLFNTYNNKTLQDVKTELSNLIQLFENSTKISPSLFAKLKSLNYLISRLPEQHNENNNISTMKNELITLSQWIIHGIETNHEKFFINIDSQKNKRPMSPLVKKLINKSHKSIDDVRPIIKAEKLPFKIESEVLSIMEEFFIIQSVLKESYIPTMHEIQQIGLHKANLKDSYFFHNTKPRKIKSRMRHTIQRLQSLYEQKEKQTNLRRELQTQLQSNKKGSLANEYEKLLQTVRQKIKIIKEEGLEKLSTQPPVSLKKEYAASKNQFEQILKIDTNMEKVLDTIAAESFKSDGLLISQKIIELLDKNRHEIDMFTKLFSQYLHNRLKVRRNAITAMEKGEMGNRIQEAVIAIYGKGSQGRRPVLGSNSIYLKLEQLTQKLAQTEAQLQVVTRTLTQLNMEYKNLMNTLLHLTHTSNSKTRQLIATAANLKNIEELILNDILSGKLGTIFGNDAIMNAEQKAQVREYIDIYNYVFDNAIKTFNNLKSSAPPALPTASE